MGNCFKQLISQITKAPYSISTKMKVNNFIRILLENQSKVQELLEWWLTSQKLIHCKTNTLLSNKLSNSQYVPSQVSRSSQVSFWFSFQFIINLLICKGRLLKSSQVHSLFVGRRPVDELQKTFWPSQLLDCNLEFGFSWIFPHPLRYRRVRILSSDVDAIRDSFQKMGIIFGIFSCF